MKTSNIDTLEGMNEFWNFINNSFEWIDHGCKCLICGKEITHSNIDSRGNGFMKISMIGHLKKHWRENHAK